ncbi:MAG TPA: FecR domain-containing protein, partial [Chitinophaga sp.]
KVSTARQTITVLGTHFNISAYGEEPQEKTSLLEGRVLVQVARQAGQALLPGQQASANANGIRIENTDVQAAIGWKKGDFIFNDDIHVIMRQLSRWYNVDVVYQGDIPDERFIASISRSKNIDQVLQALSLTHRVHFKIAARTITVMP